MLKKTGKIISCAKRKEGLFLALNNKYDLNFYLLCGSDEKLGIDMINENIKKKNCFSLSEKNIDE